MPDYLSMPGTKESCKDMGFPWQHENVVGKLGQGAVLFVLSVQLSRCVLWFSLVCTSSVYPGMHICGCVIFTECVCVSASAPVTCLSFVILVMCLSMGPMPPALIVYLRFCMFMSA